MAKPDPDEIKREVEKQDEAIYGEEEQDNDNEVQDKGIDERLEEFTGRPVKPGQNISDVVNKEEKDLQSD